MTKFGWSLGVLAFGVTGLGVCAGQSAKELHDTGMTAADQCTGLKLVCRAAAMDKKYQKDCDVFKVSLNQSSNRDLSSGFDKLEAGSYAAATRWANNVCDYDPVLAGKKRELLDAIKKAQEPAVAAKDPQDTPKVVAPKVDEVSPAKAAEAERAFAVCDFDTAATAARQVTDKALQGRAEAVLQKIASYTNAMTEARQRESSDLQGAIQSYRNAQNICSRGPGDPAGRIPVLEARLRIPAPPNNPQVGGGRPSQPPQTPPKASTTDPAVEATRLIAEGRQQEAHNLQQAMRLYENALRVQPGNPEATAGLGRVQGLINSDPKEQAKVLADGIRAYYAGKYAEAEDDLASYVSSTTAKYRGAAHFYIGASRLSRVILDGAAHKVEDAVNNVDVQRPFKDARNECYRPVGKYLSPVVLSAWNASPNGPSCAR